MRAEKARPGTKDPAGTRAEGREAALYQSWEIGVLPRRAGVWVCLGWSFRTSALRQARAEAGSSRAGLAPGSAPVLPREPSPFGDSGDGPSLGCGAHREAGLGPTTLKGVYVTDRKTSICYKRGFPFGFRTTRAAKVPPYPCVQMWTLRLGGSVPESSPLPRVLPPSGRAGGLPRAPRVPLAQQPWERLPLCYPQGWPLSSRELERGPEPPGSHGPEHQSQERGLGRGCIPGQQGLKQGPAWS